MARSRASRAADPETPLEDLASLAHEHPQLRPIIAANPSTYPDLLEWLAGLGDPDVDAAIASRGTQTDGVVTVPADLIRAGDPTTPQAELAELAHAHPGLRATIAANPNAYDDLRVWIASTEVESATTTVKASAAKPTAPATTTATATATATTPATTPAEPATASTPPRAARALGLAAIGLSIPKVALLAGAVVVTLVAGGATAYSIARVPVMITAISTGDTSVLTSGGLTGGTDGAWTNGDGSSAQPVVAPEPAYVPTVLILDASGSMVRDVAPGVTRMDAAKTAATTLVAGFGDDAQVGLTVFGTSTGNSDAERQAGCSDIRQLVPVGPLDKGALTTAIAGIQQSGFTPIGPSLRNAVDQLAGADEGLIVVVSDGVDTCAPPSSCDVAAELRASHPNITIHAVGFAVDADEQAQENLECVAQVGGGTYVDARNADQLAARLRALTDPIATAGTVGVGGIDSVQMGMSRDQVEAALGQLGVGETILDIEYVDCPYGTLQFKDGRLWAIEPRDSITTSEGLAVGDDLAAATAIYGAGVPGSDDLGTYQSFAAAPGSDSAYRVYHKVGSTKIIKIVVCLCGTGGGGAGGSSEISNWEVSFDGLGPLTFDTSYIEASAVIGVTDPDLDPCLMFSLGHTGLAQQISVLTDPEGSSDGGIVLYAFGSAGGAAASLPRTDKGVGLGSSSTEWLRAYSQSTRVFDQSVGEYLILTNAQGVSLIAGLAEGGADSIDFIQVGHKTVPLRNLGCD